MAFLKAVTTKYEHILSDAQEDSGIAVTGTISDDAINEVHTATCYIIGDDYAALPPADPALDGTPADPRYQAILAFVSDFVAAEHSRWVTEFQARQAAETARLAQLAAFPVLTTLPSGSV